MLGDLNADPNSNQGRKLYQLLNEQNFTALVREPTRITDTTSTVLDQIITNCLAFVNRTDVLLPV